MGLRGTYVTKEELEILNTSVDDIMKALDDSGTNPGTILGVLQRANKRLERWASGEAIEAPEEDQIE